MAIEAIILISGKARKDSHFEDRVTGRAEQMQKYKAAGQKLFLQLYLLAKWLSVIMGRTIYLLRH
jgi:hypothetical protein